jgi:hypothetical protein
MLIFVKQLNQMYSYDFNVWRLYQDFWFKPVISVFDNSVALPVAPTVGDRYIAMVTANAWTKDSIYEWDGTQWTATTPSEGCTVVNKNVGDTYTYLSATWAPTEDTWLDPIISIFDNTAALPIAPTIGDRYIAKVTANGWTINYVYEWQGSWLPTLPSTGMMVYNNGTAIPYIYTGGAWVQFASLTAHAIGGALHTVSTVTDIKTKVSGPDFLITSQAGEFPGLTPKPAPARADQMIIEDATDATKKKSVGIGDLVPWLYGTGAPPATTGLVDGTLFIKYIP